MEPEVLKQKLEPGIFQGTPEVAQEKAAGSLPQSHIRTMKLDVREIINKQNEAVISIAIAEGKKAARQRDEVTTVKQTEPGINPAPKRRGRFIVILLVLLLLASLSGFVYFALPKIGSLKIPSVPSFFPKDQPSLGDEVRQPEVLPLAPSIIVAQSEKRFNISDVGVSEVLESISTEKIAALAAGSIKNLYFEESNRNITSEVSVSRLFIFIGETAPELLLRSLDKPFMTGLFGEANGSPTPFLVFKVSDYDTALAGMLSWESNLPRFFSTIFGTSVATGGSATGFHDIVVLGKDARIFEGGEVGTIVYAFANRNTILITGSHTALESLLPLAANN